MAAERAIGAAALAALVFSIVWIVIAGGLNPLAPKDTVYVEFENVEFLEEGNGVVSEGIRVGVVAELGLRPQGGVLARLEIDPLITIHEGYRILSRALTIFGGRYVEIRRGDLGAPLVRGTRARPLRGEPEPEIGSNVGEMVRRAEPLLVSAVANLNEVIEKIDDAQGTLGKLLSDARLRENLERVGRRLEVTTALVDSTAAKIEKGAGTLGRLLHEPAFRQALDATVARLSSIEDKIEHGIGPLGALVSDENVAAALSAAREHLMRIVDALAQEGPEGGLGKLRDDLSRTAERLGQLVEKISSGEGPILVAARDAGVAEDLRETRRHLETLANWPRNSTVGRFINDPRLVGDVEDAVRNLSESSTGVSDWPVSPSIWGAARFFLGDSATLRSGSSSTLSLTGSQ